MPTDTLEVRNIFITDLNTGERAELNEIASINRTKKIEPIRSPREMSFSMDVSVISIETIEQLIPKVRILGLLIVKIEPIKRKELIRSGLKDMDILVWYIM